MMEGKINYNDLSGSQRQFINNSINSDFSNNLSFSIDTVPSYSFEERNPIDENELYNNIERKKKIYYVFIFMIFGNFYFILKGFELFKNILAVAIYVLLSFTFCYIWFLKMSCLCY